MLLHCIQGKYTFFSFFFYWTSTFSLWISSCKYARCILGSLETQSTEDVPDNRCIYFKVRHTIGCVPQFSWYFQFILSSVSRLISTLLSFIISVRAESTVLHDWLLFAFPDTPKQFFQLLKTSAVKSTCAERGKESKSERFPEVAQGHKIWLTENINVCDPNTREWNYNAFIIVILLYELSFTSAVEQLRQRAGWMSVMQGAFTHLITRGRRFTAVGCYSKHSSPHDSNKNQRGEREDAYT